MTAKFHKPDFGATDFITDLGATTDFYVNYIHLISIYSMYSRHVSVRIYLDLLSLSIQKV